MDDMAQEKIMSLSEILYELEKHMTGEARHSLPDPSDSIVSIAMVRNTMILTTYTGIWKFSKGCDAQESTYLLVEGIY